VANFNTHLTVAASVSGVLAIGVIVTELATIKAACLYALLGTLGGILPDVDAPKSIPTRLLFPSLGVFLASLIVATLIKRFSWLELAPLWVAIFLGAHYGLPKLFAKFTNHRGNFHSILAALLFGFISTATLYHIFGMREFVAWFAGAFVTTGYLAHLLLDEIYSVDVANKRLKKSFGSALKLASARHKLSTVLLLLATLSVFQFTPSTKEVVKILSHPYTHKIIKMKLGPLG